MKLNISQLTLAKLTQLKRHQSRTQELLGSISTFLVNLFCSSLPKPLLPTLQFLFNYGKTRMNLVIVDISSSTSIKLNQIYLSLIKCTKRILQFFCEKSFHLFLK